MRLKKQTNCRCWLLPALAVVLALPLVGKTQGIVYGQFPPTSPAIFPYDTNGTRLWAEGPDQPQTHDLLIDGQPAFTFYSGSEFSIIADGSNAVIGQVVDDLGSVFAVPLASDQPIGPNAAGYAWLTAAESTGGSALLSASRSGGIGPPLTIGYFAGLESTYIGIEFYDNQQLYYGWIRAGAPLVGINGGWIYDYAYETSPNTPIEAGAVPEPSIWALLAAGAATLFFHRKNRYLCSVAKIANDPPDPVPATKPKTHRRIAQ
jgi:hypothetical protein